MKGCRHNFFVFQVFFSTTPNFSSWKVLRLWDQPFHFFGLKCQFFSHFSLEKIFLAKYWQFFTFSKRNHLFLLKNEHKINLKFLKVLSPLFSLLNLKCIGVIISSSTNIYWASLNSIKDKAVIFHHIFEKKKKSPRKLLNPQLVTKKSFKSNLTFSFQHIKALLLFFIYAPKLLNQ